MIGVFDSGIGGVTVVKAISDTLSEYDLIYFGDLARSPYGNKSPKMVTEYALENTKFLIDKGAKIIVIGCNTASSYATQHISEKFQVPIFEVVSSAVQSSLQVTKTKNIGIIGTRGTIASGVYKRKITDINESVKVYSNACPLLVPLVEEGWLGKPETSKILKKYLHPLKGKRIDTVILGCTHYPLLKSVVKRIMGKNVHVIDSSLSVASSIKEFLLQSPEIEQKLSKKGKLRLLASDITKQFEKMAKSILKKNVPLEYWRL